MNDKQQNKLIPKLRFPEFKDSGEWKVQKLGEIGKFIGGGTPSTNKCEYWNGDILWYTPTEVKNGKLKDSIRKISKEGLKHSSAKLLPKGTLLITTRATIGDVGIAIEECTTNQGFQNLIVNDLNSNIFWFYWLLKNKNELEKRAHGSTFKEISSKEIKNIPVLRPSLPEQRKIADFLSNLDELIDVHREKLELLKKHKKGLMQNLFPQEGEKVPKLRFPEFKDSGEWEVKKLGEIFSSFSGGTPSTSNKEYYNGTIPFIRSAEIGKKETELFITEKGLKNSSAKLVKKGDLLIALYGANSGDSAISKINGAINQAILCMRSQYSNLFTYHFLTYRKKDIISRYIQGGQGNLSGDIIKSIQLPFPSGQEQRKIAECLSSLDELIEAEAEKVEQLEKHKKGLMQNLFPEI